MLRIGRLLILSLMIPSAALSEERLSDQVYQDTRQLFAPRLETPLRPPEEFSDITSRKSAPYFFAPWSAVLATGNLDGPVLARFFCNATLISPTWALTVASCVVPDRYDNLELRYGADNIEKTQAVRVAQIFVHPDFEAASEQQPGGKAPIVLLRLAIPVNTTAFAALPPGPYETSLLGAEARVTGWGSISEEVAPAEQLVQVDTLVLERGMCSSPSFYGATFDREHELCASSTVESTDACQGFSGSALIAERRGRPEAIGLVNWGLGCGRPNKPTVYIDTWAYRNWVFSTIEENS